VLQMLISILLSLVFSRRNLSLKVKTMRLKQQRKLTFPELFMKLLIDLMILLNTLNLLLRRSINTTECCSSTNLRSLRTSSPSGNASEFIEDLN
jgi:hypothetical protein